MTGNWWVDAVVILLTSAVSMLGTAWFLGRGEKVVPLAGYDPAGDMRRLIDGPQLPRAGYLPGPPFADPPLIVSEDPESLAYWRSLDRQAGGYGPFPVDTGPLLIVSETTAAGVALEREIRALGDKAEAKIPPRWR